MMRRRDVFVCAAGLVCGRVSSSAEQVAEIKKVSQEAARYQDKPKEIQSCAICSLFQPPEDCKVVEGKVSKDGWCALFDMVD
jgi:hypothetical protein